MPSLKQVISGASITVLGIFLAGVVLHAGRKNELINYARNGFDTGVL